MEPSARPSRRWWPRAEQAAVLAVAAGLRLGRIDQNGFDNEYYAAAVRSIVPTFPGSWMSSSRR